MATFYRADGWVKSVQGQAIAGAQIFVCLQPADFAFLPPTPLASIFSDPQGFSPVAQPLITDGFGHYEYYAASNTPYTEVVVNGGRVQVAYQDQVPMGATLGATSGTVTNTSGPLTAGQLVLGNGGEDIMTGPVFPGDATKFLNGAGAFTTPPAGTGTVTNTSGNLTANALVVGNGTVDEKVLASLGTTTTVLHGNASGLPSFSAVVEADITLANNTTNNVSITAHGFAPVLPNDATKFLDGTGNYSVPAGSASGTVTQIVAGTGLSGGTITTSGTIAIADTTVVPTSYTSANITVNAQGQITAASNGGGGLVQTGPKFGNWYLSRTAGNTGAASLINVGCTGPGVSGNGSSTNNAATGTAPSYIGIVPGTGAGSQASWSLSATSAASQTISVGAFRCYSTYAGLSTASNVRVWLGLVDIIPNQTITLRDTDTPAAKIVAFSYSTALAGGTESTWHAEVRSDASTSTRVDTTVTVDTNFHLFTITYDGSNFNFYIDGVLKCQIATAATGVPATTTLIDATAYVNPISGSPILKAAWQYMEGL